MRARSPEEPFGEAARTGLADLVRGEELVLRFAGLARDRYGHLLAQAYRRSVYGDGNAEAAARAWVQGALVDQGLARVDTTRDSRVCARELLAREARARELGLGLWALPAYAVRPAVPAPWQDIGRFVLIEGRISAVAETRERTYLNFGTDWRSDFTASVSRADRKLFVAEGVSLVALQGHTVRLRGWLESRNGPMITLTHPEQIERIDGAL